MKLLHHGVLTKQRPLSCTGHNRNSLTVSLLLPKPLLQSDDTQRLSRPFRRSSLRGCTAVTVMQRLVWRAEATSDLVAQRGCAMGSG